jgi:methionyl-tRNA formyltransferase
MEFGHHFARSERVALRRTPMTAKRSCVLLLRDGHYLNPSAALICRASLQVLAAVESRDVEEAKLAALKPDVVLSFLNEYILRGPLLGIQGINFHPAPPNYPGRGGASLALFDGESSYGATAHVIEAAVDSGAIIAVRRFAIEADDGCDAVYARAEIAALELFIEIVDRYGKSGEIGRDADATWGRKPTTKREFQDWLVADPADPATFIRKVRAARHPRFPGPFVDIHGFRFAYHRDLERPAT